MTQLTRIAILFLVVTLAGNAGAFETETHTLITRQAYKTSVLAQTGPTSLVHRLLLDRLDPATPFDVYWYAGSPLPEFYYTDGGVSGGAPANNLGPGDFERCNMQEFLKFPQNDFRTVLFSDTVEAPETTPALLPIQNWLVRGAVREDDVGFLVPWIYSFRTCGYTQLLNNGPTRVFNHFYDPIQNIALSPCLGTCQKSVDWGLGYVDSFASSPQVDSGRSNHFSYVDARNAYWWALTREFSHQVGQSYTLAQHEADAEDRMRLWATTFRALGDVIHLLQDAGQPQHTRNDPHSPVTSNGEQQAFEGFTNARVLGQTGAAGNSYIRDFFGRKIDDQLPAPPLGTYGTTNPVTLATPLRFFTTRLDGTAQDVRGGLADYTNRGFFTGGTLPGSSGSHPEPKPSLSAADGYSTISVPCMAMLDADLRLGAVPCVHYTHAVPDAVASGYVDSLPPGFTLPNVPLASQSAFLQPSSEAGVTMALTQTALAPEELIAMGNLTIPRAIGYSAGLINYFFRGTIQVDAPTDGVFGVIDQGIAHTVDVDGYPHCTGTVAGVSGEPNFCTANAIFGFTKVRLAIRNSTPSLTESGTATTIPQTMSATTATPGANDPRLVAVARYHRNPCYKSTLQTEAVVDYLGNFTPSSCAPGDRTAYQEISVSAPAANSNGTTSTTVAFDFSNDPIPINATDLFIQVVYRGPMGNAATFQEPDAIAVGMIDVREPTYLALWNNTDYAGCNGQWVQDPLPPGCTSIGTTDRVIDTARLCIGTQLLYTVTVPNILLGQYVRLAALLDDQSHHTRARLIVGAAGTEVAILNKTIMGQQRQALMEHETALNPYVPEAMFIKRGIIGSLRPIPWYEIMGTLPGADPQPANDLGTNDVGSRTPVFATGSPNTGGAMSFPNLPPAPLASCTN